MISVQKQKLCLLLLSAFTSLQVMAQGKVVTGTVTSSDNKQPLSGVNVTVKGTRTATATDGKGNYRITVNGPGAVLVFSSASFVAHEVPVGDATILDIVMQPDTKSLTDVVVIGYQTVRRKDLLASVSSVSARDLKDIPINSA